MTTVRVVIDMREDDLWAALEGWRVPGEEHWYVEKAALEVGDIAFFVGEQEKALLERKTAEDLGASQRDGRYREQRARLLAKRGAGAAIGYIVEAPAWSPSLTRSWCRGAFTEVALQQAIVRLQMRYTIPVFQAASIRETVQWIRRIAMALAADSAVFSEGLATTQQAAASVYTEAIHVKKAANLSSDRILGTLLRTIPGCGAAAADAIVNHVGSGGFPAFYELSEETIAAISQGKRKIGKVLAAKLWSVFHSSEKIDEEPSP